MTPALPFQLRLCQVQFLESRTLLLSIREAVKECVYVCVCVFACMRACVCGGKKKQRNYVIYFLVFRILKIL